MKKNIQPKNQIINFFPPTPKWFLLVVSLALPLSAYWLQSDIDLPNPDEEYLWNGSLQTLSGEIPLRDFQSHDPAHYYW